MKKLMKYREIKTGNIYDVEDISGLNCFDEYDYLDFKPYALAYTPDTVIALATKLQRIAGK